MVQKRDRSGFECNANKPVTLSLGKIDDNDDTYVNGIWVGSTKNWAEKRIYHVPAGVFKTGKNLLQFGWKIPVEGVASMEILRSIYIKSENGFTALSESWNFRVAKIAR